MLFGLGCQSSQQSQPDKGLSSQVYVPVVGQAVPNIALQDESGRTYRISDFKGNLLFLNFWATWCPPCIQELPLMDAVNQRLKAKNFTMIAISVDDSWSKVREFYSSLSRPPSFLVLLDPKGQLTSGLGVSKFPETMLIDSQGRLIKKYIGAWNWMDAKILDEWEDFLKKPE